MQKLFWTVTCLLVYLVCTQMPLYGIASSKSSDPFYIMRMILASSRYVVHIHKEGGVSLVLITVPALVLIAHHALSSPPLNVQGDSDGTRH